MPFGQVPVLKIDDKRLPQSGAIVRYLAREFKLMGDNPLHAAFADMLVETLNDHLYKFPFVEKDEEKRVSPKFLYTFFRKIHIIGRIRERKSDSEYDSGLIFENLDSNS